LDQGRDSRTIRRSFRRLRNLQAGSRLFGRSILCSLADLYVREAGGSFDRMFETKPKSSPGLWISHPRDSPRRGVNVSVFPRSRVRSASGNASATISERTGASERICIRRKLISLQVSVARARARAGLRAQPIINRGTAERQDD